MIFTKSDIYKDILTISCLLTAATMSAQTVMHGTVIDGVTDNPVAGASVVAKGSDGKIKKFATTKSDGTFNLSIAPRQGFKLEVSAMSYKKLSIDADSMSYPLTLRLEPGGIKLKEVAVKAARIREQGDTITYNVGAFANKRDRSIGDVLKRMPGIDVEKGGRIKYQGEDINKFYIEGTDLLGGRYGIATESINHDDVGAVEVMENHQPMQVLSGISFSDKAAINLKLKNKAKATWSAHGMTGGGCSWQPEGVLWDGELFAMAVMPTFQNMTSIRTNNTGKTLRNALIDFFGGNSGTNLSRYLELSLPGVPSLNRNRTLFNRSVTVSTNNLKKLKSGEFKANIDYIYDRLESSAENITTYFLPDGGNRIITENRSGHQYSNSISSNFIYELNHKKTFLNNTLKANASWDRISLLTTGTIPNEETAKLPDYSVSNHFRMINRVKNKHLVTFESLNSWESIPQTLNMIQDINSYRQHVTDLAFYSNETASYSFTLKGLSIGLDGGIRAYLRTMKSELPEIPDEIPGITENVINTNYTSLYVTPHLEYWLTHVNLKLNLPLSYTRYTFDKALANRNEVYFSPSLSMSWKPNNRFEGTLHGSIGRSPMSLGLIHPGVIMTSYRTFKAGVVDFYNTTSQNLSASFSYRHVRQGIFANGNISHSWSHIPYTMSQQLLGDYAIYSYSNAKNSGRSLNAAGNIGKTLYFLRGSFNLKGSFRRSESHLLSQRQSVRSVSKAWTTGAKIDGNISSWLSMDYELEFTANRLEMNGKSKSWLSSVTNEANITITPHELWQIQLRGEHYRNELTEDNFKDMVLFDTIISYSPLKKVEISASLSNLLNKKIYSYRTYSQLSSFESMRHIRGRELAITITLRK